MPLTVGEVWEMIADLNDKTPVVLLLPGAGEDEWEEVDIDIQVDVGSLLNTAVIITGSRSIEAVGVGMAEPKDLMAPLEQSLKDAELKRLRALLDQYQAKNERLLIALTEIAQYDPRWKGQHVNNAPNRQQLIERAYDALGGAQGA